MKANIESSELAELIKLGQTGIITSDGAYALGCLMETFGNRVEAIYDVDMQREYVRKNHRRTKLLDRSYMNYSLSSSGFMVHTSQYDYCNRSSDVFEDDWCVSFEEFLDPDYISRTNTEIDDMIKTYETQKSLIEVQKATTAAASKLARDKATYDRLKRQFGDQ